MHEMIVRQAWFRAFPFLLIAACTDGPGAELTVGVAGQTDLLRPRLTVFATAGRWQQSWRGSEIGSDEAPNHSMPVQTPDAGTLQIRAVLNAADGELLAAGEADLVLESDWRWGVTVWWTDRDPALECFGCMGRIAIPIPAELRSNPSDSLYLVWGGNSIRNPVVY